MASMPARMTRYRRPLTVALPVVAGLALILVALALWNRWRLTALYPLATAGGAITTLTLAGGLLATAAVLALMGTHRRAVIGLLVGLVAVPALCVGLPSVVFDSSFRDRSVLDTRVLATSPEGDYSVVALTMATPPETRLYIRSRSWLFSREAATPVAQCPRDPFAGEVAPEAVRFTDETTVAVPVEGQSSVTVEFDASTLEPRNTVDMCPQPPS